MKKAVLRKLIKERKERDKKVEAKEKETPKKTKKEEE